jgi:hypothetical protein
MAEMSQSALLDLHNAMKRVAEETLRLDMDIVARLGELSQQIRELAERVEAIEAKLTASGLEPGARARSAMRRTRRS